MRPLPVLLLLLAACGGQPDPEASTRTAASGSQEARAPEPFHLDHDFGVVPHGEKRTHEFPLDLGRFPEPMVPLRVHIECSCGHADVRYRKADGSERFSDGSPYARNLPSADESAILHVDLDTARREAVDLPPTASHGYIILQPLSDTTGSGRVQLPFTLRFGVDAPVVLLPFATLDFGRVAQSQQGMVVTTMTGDERHRGARFLSASSSDPNLEVELEPADGHVRLRAIVQPGNLGSYRAEVAVATDLPQYELRIAATWKVVPDLEATPMAKISFRTPLARAQEPGAEARQFVLLTDHDRSRPPEFSVLRIVDERGTDCTKAFAVRFEEVPGQERQRRLLVRYLGGLDELFRGELMLTKNGAEGPFLPIELVVFPQKS